MEIRIRPLTVGPIVGYASDVSARIWGGVISRRVRPVPVDVSVDALTFSSQILVKSGLCPATTTFTARSSIRPRWRH